MKPAKIIVKSPAGGKITAPPDKGTTVPKSGDDKKTDVPENTAATEKTPPEKSTTRSLERRDGAGDTHNYCGIIGGFQ